MVLRVFKFKSLLGFFFCIAIFSSANTGEELKRLGPGQCPSGGVSSDYEPTLPRGCNTEESDLVKFIREEDKSNEEEDPCLRAALIAVKCCINPTMEECRWVQSKIPFKPRAGNIVEAFDEQIDTYVQGHNVARRRQSLCHWKMNRQDDSCTKECTSRKEYFEKEVEKLKAQGNANPDLISAATIEAGQAEVLLEEICKSQGEQLTRCHQSQAIQYKVTAQNTLACSHTVKKANSPTHQIVCFRTEQGVELCQYTASGNPFVQDLSEYGGIEYNKQGFGRNWKANGGSCTGTAVGDGSEVVTAHHCVPANGEMKITVFDDSGQAHTRNMNCAFNPSYSGQGVNDTSICKLDSPVPMTNNNMLLTHDPTITDGQCRVEDYVYRCPTSVIQSMHGKNVQIISYPVSQKRNGRYEPIISNSQIFYDESTNTFYTDAFADPGSSGGSYLYKMEGNYLIVTNQAYKWYPAVVNQSPVVGWSDVSKMRATLTPAKVNGAEGTFQ